MLEKATLLLLALKECNLILKVLVTPGDRREWNLGLLSLLPFLLIPADVVQSPEMGIRLERYLAVQLMFF